MNLIKNPMYLTHYRSHHMCERIFLILFIFLYSFAPKETYTDLINKFSQKYLTKTTDKYQRKYHSFVKLFEIVVISVYRSHSLYLQPRFYIILWDRHSKSNNEGYIFNSKVLSPSLPFVLRIKNVYISLFILCKKVFCRL